MAPVAYCLPSYAVRYRSHLLFLCAGCGGGAQGEKEIVFFFFVVEEEDDEEECHSYGYIAVGYVEFGEIDGDEVDKIYNVPVGNAVDKVADSAAENKHKGKAHQEVAFTFGNLVKFDKKKQHGNRG